MHGFGRFALGALGMLALGCAAEVLEPGEEAALDDGAEQEVGVLQSAVANCALRNTTSQSCAYDLWPNGKIYYEFDSSVTREGWIKAAFENHLSDWERVTGGRIDFIESPTAPARLKIFDNMQINGGSCAPGYGGIRNCFLNADQWTGVHELGHAIGLPHYHLRNDCDRHLIVDDSGFPCQNDFYSDSWRKCDLDGRPCMGPSTWLRRPGRT